MCMNIPGDSLRLGPAAVTFPSEKQWSGFEGDELSAANKPSICLASRSYPNLFAFVL